MRDLQQWPASPSVSGREKQQAATKSTLVSVLVNIFLTIGQIVIGLISHSSGLVADGVHSLSDLFSDLVVLLANRFSHKAADQEHPYGHFRFETAAALVLGALLLCVGIGLFWSAIGKFFHPHAIVQVHQIALWAALLALLVKELLFRYLLAVARRVGSGMLTANAWHARSDAASSLVVAFGVAGTLLGWPLLDPLAACVVSLMVCRMGAHFSYDAFQDLMDRGLLPEQVETLRQTLSTVEGMVSAHDIRTRKMGDLIIVDVHLLVDSHLSVSEGHQIALRAQQALMAAGNLSDVTIHVDADQEDGGANRNLPARSQVLQDIAIRLGSSTLPETAKWILHYLDGSIEITVLLPVGETTLARQLRDLRLPCYAKSIKVYVELKES